MAHWCVLAVSGGYKRLIHDWWLQRSDVTIFVFDVWAGATLKQFQGTLLLSSIGCTVQRRVTQQVCTVDVRRLLQAQLQRTHRKKDSTDGLAADKRAACHLIFGDGTTLGTCGTVAKAFQDSAAELHFWAFVCVSEKNVNVVVTKIQKA